MAETEYQFDRQSAERIAKTVRRVEQTLRPDGRGVITTGSQGGQRVALVIVTSATPNANGYYPGRQYVAAQAAIQDPAPPLTQGTPPPGFGTAGNYGNYGNASQGNDCWISSNTAPSVNQILPGIVAAAHTDGKPIYYVGGGGSAAAGWSGSISSNNSGSPWGFTTAPQTINTQSLVLPQAGTYLVTVRVQGELFYTATPTGGNVPYIYAGVSSANVGALTLGTIPPVVAVAGPASNFPSNAQDSGHAEVSFLFTVGSPHTSDTLTVNASLVLNGGNLANIFFGTTAITNVAITAVLYTSAPTPGTTTINGLSSGITFQGGGSGPVAGSGVGLEIITNPLGTITAGLSAAALAALNSYLARVNI